MLVNAAWNDISLSRCGGHFDITMTNVSHIIVEMYLSHVWLPTVLFIL